MIELLIVLGIVALLIAIAFPSLSHARFSSKALRSLAVQRQLAHSISLYCQSSRDAYPYMGTPGDPTGPVMVNGVNVSFQGYFTDQCQHWSSLIVPDYCDVNALNIETRESVDPSGLIRARYFLTEAVFADPRLFTEWTNQPPPPNSYFRATKTIEVAYASRKGLLVDISLGVLAGDVRHGRDLYLVCFADNSAATHSSSEINWNRVVNQPYSNSAKPVLNTRDGLAGFDF